MALKLASGQLSASSNTFIITPKGMNDATEQLVNLKTPIYFKVTARNR
jgi:hypothetical protein